MVQCEMCGTETESPTTSKIEGAELQVCSSCADFGTAVSRADTPSSTTKYSTGTSTGTTKTTTTSSTQQSRSGGRDLFDEMDTLAADYNDRIREARESRGYSQEELAQELNEKASLIRKLERGDMQPNDSVQTKLERKLDIALTESASDEDDEWKSDVSPGETTLGDVVRRKE